MSKQAATYLAEIRSRSTLEGYLAFMWAARDDQHKIWLRTHMARHEIVFRPASAAKFPIDHKPHTKELKIVSCK
jgi:hypothetical protein